MNKDNIAENLKVQNLEEYFIAEYKQGQIDADLLTEDYFSNSIAKLNELSSEETKIPYILKEIINLKELVNRLSVSEFHQLTRRAKDFASNNLINIPNEEDQLTNLASYIINYFEFQKTQDWLIQQKISKTRENSKEFHLVTNLILKSEHYFYILNSICKIDPLTWNWSNFDKGLIKVLHNYSLEKILYKAEHKLALETLEINKEFEANELKSQIKDLKYEITSKERELEREINGRKREIELLNNYYNKYYYNTQTISGNTYFGDNQPFLFNLFNFLTRNNLFPYGWGYFHSCLIEGNNEIIPLETSPKNVKPIGRVFYHLKDLLIKHYKDEAEKFIRAKFYINNEPLSSYFFTNHVYKNADSELLPFIGEIDDFFEKQKKIYLKYNK